MGRGGRGKVDREGKKGEGRVEEEGGLGREGREGEGNRREGVVYTGEEGWVNEEDSIGGGCVRPLPPPVQPCQDVIFATIVYLPKTSFDAKT